MNDHTHSGSALDSAWLREAYTQMRRIRLFEEACLQLERSAEIRGPLHVSLGQEAVAVGACQNLTVDDVIVSTHRGHHHCLAKGADLGRMFAELMGRETGWARGRGGSMHIVDPTIGVLGTNGIVGAGLPMAVGAAYTFALRQRPHVAIAFFGEGASSTGNLAECLNMARLWDLPVIFICENNQFVELGPAEAHVSGELWRRGEPFGVPGVRVDGNDVQAMSDCVATAVDRARTGGGPSLIEAVTYRWLGHYTFDPGEYMPVDELERWKSERDPIKNVAALLDPQERQWADREAEQAVAQALEFAHASPMTSEETLYADSEVAPWPK